MSDIIGAYGFNDQQYTDAYVISDAREYDRETLYGAENYALQQLFAVKPKAKVVLMGIQTRSYSNAKKSMPFRRLFPRNGVCRF